MKLNMACNAQAGHKEFIRKHLGFRPTVLAAKRLEAIVSRSRQDNKRQILAAVEEEQRYKQYLKDGNDALCKCFTNLKSHQANDDDVVQAAKDKALAEETKELRAQVLLEELRKERVMRANHILHLLKPGPRALRQALLESEVIHQRKYDESIKQDISRDALCHRRLEDLQCPNVLIPFAQNTEEPEKAHKKEKSLDIRAYFLQDIEERRQRKLSERKQNIQNAIIEREKLNCQKNIEDEAAIALKARKREICRLAYKAALKEKEEKTKFDKICDQIDHRIRCVNLVAHRNLDIRYKKQILDLRANKVPANEDRTVQVCKLQQEANRRREEAQAKIEKDFQVKADLEEAARKCRREELSKQRQAYELEERKQGGQNRLRVAEARRFDIATRYKNDEANKKFFMAEKEQQDKRTVDLRQILYDQRQEFLQQRQDELMRLTACDEDPYLEDDIDFFNETFKTMQDCQELGRPIFPLAKAAEHYKRENKLDLVPEGQMIRRNTSRDKCWPGFVSKAQLAFKKYEHREKCRQENEQKLNNIFDNCIKITKMASEEQPFKPCIQSGHVKCKQYKGIPILPLSTSEIPNNVTVLPEQPNESSCIDLKGSTLSFKNKRGEGGEDPLTVPKMDGISRSLFAKISTKQKRSARLAQVPQIVSAQSDRNFLITEATKLKGPAWKSQSIQNDAVQSNKSHKVLPSTKIRSLDIKLHDTKRYSASRMDLTKYWTPNLLNRQQKVPSLNR